MRRLSVARLILAAVMLISMGSKALAAFPGFDQAVADYNQRKYAQSLTAFTQIARSHPTDALTHYYMGMCYQGLSQIGPARDQYTWIYANSTDPRLRYHAYQALQQIEKWKTNRAYSGQGNNFQRYSAPSAGGGGGDGSASQSGSNCGSDGTT